MYNNAPEAGIASLLASRGRNGDSVLVHMTPEEVHGLHALALAHGGELTINPHTGLYEANFLKKLLPTILGFGLNFLFPGLGALGSGLLVGAGETIRTGGDLGKGLMAGLGAFGGAGLGSALSGVGAAAKDASTKLLAEESAKNLAKDAGAKAAQEAVTSQVKTMAAPEFAKTLTLGERLSNVGTGFKELATGSQNLGVSPFGGIKALGSTMGMPAVSSVGMTAANALTPDFELPNDPYQMDDSYYESYGYDPEQGRFLGGRWLQGYPGFPRGMAEGGPVNPPTYSGPLSDYMAQLNQFVASPIAAPKRAENASIAPNGTGNSYVAGNQPDYMAIVNRLPNFGKLRGKITESMKNQAIQQEAAANPYQNMRWDPDQGRFVAPTPFAPQTVQQPQTPYSPSMYGGYDFGQMDMQRYAGGGNVEYAAGGTFINGPGDGMSDDVVANIEGRQEARLADGEFVIPADVVSHIGNGSSDAGADKLHEMMDRVREARTGSTEQAPEIDPNEFLPA